VWESGALIALRAVGTGVPGACDRYFAARDTFP
jgi:hypothetical protein